MKARRLMLVLVAFVALVSIAGRACGKDIVKLLEIDEPVAGGTIAAYTFTPEAGKGYVLTISADTYVRMLVMTQAEYDKYVVGQPYTPLWEDHATGTTTGIDPTSSEVHVVVIDNWENDHPAQVQITLSEE